MTLIRHWSWTVTVFVALLVASGSATAQLRETDFVVRTQNTPVASIAGHVFPARGEARGTLIVCHGYGRNKEAMRPFNWVCDQPGWNMVSFDFREHGQSTRTIHLSTLGYYEIYDLKAVVDYCESQHMARPFVIYGNSLGASVGLRWASTDRRISGVFAASPFSNAYDASREIVRYYTHLPLPSPFVLARGFARMLKQVDIPSAVARRDDLRISILVGEHDAFSISEEHQILNSSKSPSAMKHLYVIPGANHSGSRRWKGDSIIPSHDDLLRRFLADCLETERPQDQ